MKAKKSKAKPEKPKVPSEVAELKAALQDVLSHAQNANGAQNETEWRFRCTEIEKRARAALGL